MIETNTKYRTVKEVANMLGVACCRVYQLRDKGRLNTDLLGTGRVVYVDELLEKESAKRGKPVPEFWYTTNAPETT